MKLIRILSSVGALSLVAFAIALAFIPQFPNAIAGTTTSTITGWNVPSGTTFGHGLIAFILPLVTMAGFAGLALLFEIRGNIVVTLALVGYEAGTIIGMLAFPTNAAPTYIPFANAILGGIVLAIWIWKGSD